MSEEAKEAQLDTVPGTVELSKETNQALWKVSLLTWQLREVSERTFAVAEATEEIGTSVSQIAAAGDTAAHDADEAHHAAQVGKASVDTAGEAMNQILQLVKSAAGQVDRLAEASNQIDLIVAEIETIAKQTNLLASNATIEAVRAAEAGRGFAAVATEANGLATQTARTTEDIRCRIAGLHSEVEAIVGSMNAISAGVENGQKAIAGARRQQDGIAAKIDDVATRIHDISGILQGQRQAAVDVSQGMTDIASITFSAADQIGHAVDALHRAEAMVAEKLAVADASSPEVMCAIAQSDHYAFKKLIIETLVGRGQLKPEDIPDHHACRLGKWYDSITDAQLRSRPEFGQLVKPHWEVHQTAKDALKAFHERRFEAAAAAAQELDQASAEVVSLLERLRMVIAKQA